MLRLLAPAVVRGDGPTAGIQVGVVVAHILCCEIQFPKRPPRGVVSGPPAGV